MNRGNEMHAIIGATTTAVTLLVFGVPTVTFAAELKTMTAPMASRFLARATFGPTTASINELTGGTPEAWLANQFNLPQSRYLTYLDQFATPTQTNFQEKFWSAAVKADDQLRQRVAFALSEIFVVSFQEANLGGRPRCVGDYYDTLAANAFGNFRTLLEAVALHPAMGIYLSHFRNQKESGNRQPDENFAREIMQLFTIGLYQLNPDGSQKKGANGLPIETYTHADVVGLARVFTGWAAGGPDKSGSRFMSTVKDPNWEVMPMQNYPDYHSSSNKDFLGVGISGATSGEADLAVALDTLFQHPNVGPFIGRQLIQRLVTSNPSAAYVERVGQAFDDNGQGVRGDMKAVITAVLLDPEATSTAPVTTAKVREPILRLANWLRAFNASSKLNTFSIGNLDDPINGLGEAPLRSPSVFNFYRPGYTPPNTAIADAGQVAPEMQIVGEPNVTGYLNYMQNALNYGIGTGYDVQVSYSVEVAYADPAQLVAHIDLLLLNGGMSPALRAQIEAAVKAIAIPATSTPDQILKLKTARAKIAIYLAMASAEYIVQQ
jgi:uncharacterized protein (DUF1800 family)